MNFKTFKKLFLIINGFILSLCIFYLLTLNSITINNNQNYIRFFNVIKQKKIYQKILNNNKNIKLTFPTVQINPNLQKYKLVLLKEYFEAKTSKYDELFFASKRIAELQKWGRELDWKEVLKRYSNHVNAYWNSIDIKNEPNIYPDLKATLDYHHRLLEQLIYAQSDDIEKNIVKIQIVDDVFNNFRFLIPKNTPVYTNNMYFPMADIVNNKEFGNYDFTATIKNDYHYTFALKLSLNNKFYQPETITSIDSDSQQAIFKNVVVDKNTPILNNLYLQLPVIRNDPTKWEETYDENIETYTYKTPINSISRGDYKIKLSYDINNPVSFKLFDKVATTEGKIKYRNDLFFIDYLYPHGYQYNFEGNFYKEKASPDLIDTYLLIESKKQIPQTELNSISLSFIPLPQIELQADKISDLPNINPQIRISKINRTTYDVLTIDTTIDQDNAFLGSLGFGWKITNQIQFKNQSSYTVSYWLIDLLIFINVILLGTVLFVLFFQRWMYLRLKHYLALFYKKIVVKSLYFFWKVIKFICIEFRYLALLLTLFGILASIFILRGSYDLVILITIGFWVIALIGYTVEARINFLLALIFLVFCPFLISLHQDNLAEIMAVWAYMFLAVGTIQTLIEFKIDEKHLVSIPYFLKHIFGYAIAQTIVLFIFGILKNIVIFIKNILITFASFFTLRIIKTFSYLNSVINRVKQSRPKTFKDLVFYYTKIFIIIGLIVIFTVFIIALPIIIGFMTTKTTIALNNYAVYVQNKIKDDNFQKERLALNPVILKVEPSIVYPGTKVIVFGKGFNSRAIDKSLNKAILKGKSKDDKEGEKIITDYWDDNKIIFTIPLNWKYGYNHLWIDKPIIWNGKQDLAKSNVASLKLIPVSSTFTPDDDEYFRLLPTYDKETLKINGYE